LNGSIVKKTKFRGLAHFRNKTANFAAWLKIPRATENYGS